MGAFDEQPSRLQLVGRITVSLTLLAYMFTGPLLRELRVSHSRHLPEWKMFHWTATDPSTCAVEFFTDDGPIDRLAALGLPDPTQEKTKRHKLLGPRAVHTQARQLCRTLDARPRVLHARAKCATMQGWKPLYDGSENLCTIKPPPEKRRKKQANKAANKAANKNKRKNTNTPKTTRRRAKKPGA